MIFMKQTESTEMYLENILVLSQKTGSVRAIDISRYSGYSKPSVSRAMGILREGGFIRIDTFGIITLTETGYAVASKILERHRVLTEMLKSFGISDETAAEDACRIEHVISDETFGCIKNSFPENGKK